MAGQARHYAAGILPITWYEDTALFLVGKDLRDDTYSDFGGKNERVDKNDVINTSVREFYEESLGMVLPTKALRQRICAANSLCLHSKTQNGHPYYMFVVEVPYMPHLRNAFHKTLAFLKYRNLHKLYVEKTDVQWVTARTLLNDLPKRSVFAQTLATWQSVLVEVSADPAGWAEACSRYAAWHDVVA
jgi:hypothetical protein